MQMKALVLRIWRDEHGALRGQLSDPQTLERAPFSDSAELWQLINEKFCNTQSTQTSSKEETS